MIRPRNSIIITIIGCIILPTVVWAGKCIDWPRVMALSAIEDSSKGPLILLKPLSNYTKRKGDDWLSIGYRDFLADLLSTSRSARVRAGNTAKYDPAAANPRYVVGGKFLRTKEDLRIFIEVKDGVDKKIIKVMDISIPYPDNAEFFYRTAATAREIGRIANITFTEKDFKRLSQATTSTLAFENYQKGRQALETMNPRKFDIAKIWFDETIRADFNSWLGYQGLVDLYSMQGLMAKLEGRPFTMFFQMAEGELDKMQKLSQQRPKDDSLRLDNRFLKGNAAYLRGISALRAGDNEAAAKQLRKAASEVPEDALAWTKLAQALSALGKLDEANQARANARKVNSCI